MTTIDASRLAAPDERIDTRSHVNWGALHPDDDRVRLMFVAERIAREYVDRTPGAQLVKAVVTVTTSTSYSAWETVVDQ